MRSRDGAGSERLRGKQIVNRRSSNGATCPIGGLAGMETRRLTLGVGRLETKGPSNRDITSFVHGRMEHATTPFPTKSSCRPHTTHICRPFAITISPRPIRRSTPSVQRPARIAWTTNSRQLRHPNRVRRVDACLHCGHRHSL